MLSATLLAVLLPALTYASPLNFLLPRQNDTHPDESAGMIALASGTVIHFGTVNASDNAFYIGRPTDTYCPSTPEICSGLLNITMIHPYDTGVINMQAIMEQIVFVDATGALSFTTAHEEDIYPPGSYVSGGFMVEEEESVSLLQFTQGASQGWVACPITPDVDANGQPLGPFQVFASVVGFSDHTAPLGCTEDCIGFDMALEWIPAASPPGAYEYD